MVSTLFVVAVAAVCCQPALEATSRDVMIRDNVTAPLPPFSFTAPTGPTFTAAEKQAQRERGAGVVPLVREAFAAGAATVTIPPGDYRFGKETWGPGGPIYPLEFRGLRRDAEHPLRILAEGVTLWFELPPDQAPHAHFALGFVDCSHLSLEGATLDRDPRGCMEGRITQIDDANNRIEIEATAGTLIPTAFSGELNQRLVPFNADGTFCAALYGLQRRPGQLRYRDISPGSEPGRYWVNLDEKSELLETNRDPAWHRTYGDAGTLQPGDGLSLVYATATAIGVTECSDMTFIGLRNYLSKGMVHELRGGGGHVWKDCFFGPRPGTCHWQGADGFLTGCLERGSTYDGLTMMHTTDDVMNMHGYWGYPENVDGHTVTLNRGHQMPARPGDELTFYDADTGAPVGKACVRAVTGQRITLDRDAAAFATAIAENCRFQCDGWEIRNCTFTDCYQRLLVQGGNGGTLRDSSFTRMGGHISLQSNFFTKNEGGICRNIRVENNTFDRVAIHPDGIALVADFKPLQRESTGTVLRDITVCGNRFLHCGTPAIAFGKVDGGLISGNRFERSVLPRHAAGAGGPPDPIVLEHCRNIEEREKPPHATAAEPAADGLAAPVAKTPNVIVILADDLGYADVGFQGCRDIPMPNLDALAAGGVRCTSGYVTWPACAPSRASIITGQDSHRFGFHDNPTPVLATDQGLPAGIMTVPRALQQRGFITGGIGKWHLGTTPDRHPNTVGFTEWYGFLGGAHEYFPRDSYATWCQGAKERYPKRPWPEWFINITLPILRNREPVATQRYLTDHLSDEAVDFIERHRRDPFFLYLAFNAPHSPYEAPEDEEAKYDLNAMADIDGVTPAQRRTYAAMVSRLDRGVGEVLAALREHGLEEKTLIFFLSDNGGGHPGPGYSSSNHPLRGYKGDLYEGGIRVPFVASWKGTIPAGTTYDQPVSSMDTSATALALAGGGPAGMRLDGVNLIPHLTGRTKEPPHERLFWKHHARGAIREGRYKLITGHPEAERELYDLSADPAEATNLASENTDLVRRLDAAWQAWNAEMAPPAWQKKPQTDLALPEYQGPLWPEEKAAADNTTQSR